MAEAIPVQNRQEKGVADKRGSGKERLNPCLQAAQNREDPESSDGTVEQPGRSVPVEKIVGGAM